MTWRAAFNRAQLLFIGGVFLPLGAFFVVVAVCVAVTVQPHPALLVVFCMGAAVAALGWVVSFHGASAVVGREGVTLAWVTGGERLVTGSRSSVTVTSSVHVAENASTSTTRIQVSSRQSLSGSCFATA
jgi:hypothetical protein